MIVRSDNLPAILTIPLTLLTLLVHSTFAENRVPIVAATDTEIQVIEEILVTAIDRCGPWPIAHESIIDCTYPELKREQLQALREMREKYFDVCLTCSENACEPRELPPETRQQKFLCKRLFQTPRRVPRTQLRVVDVGYLVADFTYDISARGNVDNLRIMSLESDLEDAVVLELITEAAAEARFEPVRRHGKALPLLNIEDSYILEP